MLLKLERAPLAAIRARALEARARRGDPEASKALELRRTSDPETNEAWEAALALARMGDASAVLEVTRVAREAAGSMKATALGALRGIPTAPPVVEVIAEALKHGDDVVKDAAADAAIGRTDPMLAGPLRDVMRSSRFTAPLRAAVALMRMDDRSGQALVEANLGGDLPDGRIIAAQAYVGRPDTAWVAKLEPVLRDANPLLRILAAELLLPVRPRDALQALGPALEDENPVLRAEAVRVLAGHPGSPLAALRAALTDEAAWVRFHAAEALARRPAAEQGPASPRPSGRKRPR